ncbi:MAG: hypothetical protein K8F91_12945 [Candidatus Obscuribacterales bacterium]|nr:hypothetical protein [Candidatus Obscuribacterales bacterium]
MFKSRYKTSWHLLALLLIASPAALADDKPILIAQRAERGGVGAGAWQILRKPMELPDLPAYTGQSQFISGLMYPNKPGGAAISMRYMAKEDAGTVSQWYADTLKANSWKTAKATNDSSIRAQKGGNGVTIRVTPAKKSGFKSEMKISYKLSQ